MKSDVKIGVIVTIVGLLLCGKIIGSVGRVGEIDSKRKNDGATEVDETDEEGFTGTKTETEIGYTDYKTKIVKDSKLEYGKKKVKTKGVDGEVKYTYKVKYKNGFEVSRKQVKKEVIKKPVTEVIAKGAKIIWHCEDATSYNRNPYDDNYCENSKGQYRYVSDSQARALDPSYSPGQAGHWWYNSK